MFCRHIPNRCEVALAIVRITLGVVFIAHGAQKVLGLWGGPGLDGFAQFTASLGAPEALGYIAAFIELIGGLLLLIGAASEVAALALVPVMLGAILLVHLKNGFFSQNGGYEYALVLLLLLVAIIVGGPGKWYTWCACKLSGCPCKHKK